MIKTPPFYESIPELVNVFVNSLAQENPNADKAAVEAELNEALKDHSIWATLNAFRYWLTHYKHMPTKDDITGYIAMASAPKTPGIYSQSRH